MVGRGNFRGDLNAVLNRLVREGVIAAFRTNFSVKDSPAGLCVMVTPNGADAGSVKDQVHQALAPLARDGIITIEDQSAKQE
jgi:hypothetical protein